jgi:hypothetical protein
VDAVEHRRDAAAVDRGVDLLAQECGHALLELRLHLDRNGGAAVEAEIEPLLQVLRTGHDLVAHLVGLDVEKHAHRGVVLAPQVAVLEARVPGILPVEFERLRASQVAEVVDGEPAVIGDEAQVHGGPSGSERWRQRECLRAPAQRILEHGEDHRLRLFLVAGERLARDVIAACAHPRSDFPHCAGQWRAAVRAEHEVLARKAPQPLREGLRRVSQALVERVG